MRRKRHDVWLGAILPPRIPTLVRTHKSCDLCKLKMQHPARLRRAIGLKRRIWRYNRYPSITTFERSERSINLTIFNIIWWFDKELNFTFFRLYKIQNNKKKVKIILRGILQQTLFKSQLKANGEDSLPSIPKKVKSYAGHFLISRPTLKCFYLENCYLINKTCYWKEDISTLDFTVVIVCFLASRWAAMPFKLCGNWHPLWFLAFIYSTCTIITCGLYIFYPIFHCSLYWRFILQTIYVSTKNENSSFF